MKYAKLEIRLLATASLACLIGCAGEAPISPKATGGPTIERKSVGEGTKGSEPTPIATTIDKP